MKRRALLRLLPLAAFAAAAPRAVFAAEQTPKPGAKDTCPVCGMLVSKYPQWTASVAFKDGHAHHFDGAKDLFKYLFDMPKYGGGHTRADVAAIEVTEYYGLTKIDARMAFYVVGSDVLGPMGHELIPFASRADAEEFLKDHKGQRIVGFDEVTPALVTQLDKSKPN